MYKKTRTNDTERCPTGTDDLWKCNQLRCREMDKKGVYVYSGQKRIEEDSNECGKYSNCQKYKICRKHQKEQGINKIKYDTDKFARLWVPSQDEKSLYQQRESGQFPSNGIKIRSLTRGRMKILTKVTDKLIVHTPTIVSHPLIHDNNTRCFGEPRRKHQ